MTVQLMDSRPPKQRDCDSDSMTSAALSVLAPSVARSRVYRRMVSSCQCVLFYFFTYLKILAPSLKINVLIDIFNWPAAGAKIFALRGFLLQFPFEKSSLLEGKYLTFSNLYLKFSKILRYESLSSADISKKF